MPAKEPAAGSRRGWARAALGALLAFNLLALFVYICFTYRLQFHSDAAVKNLFAGEMLAARSPFPGDWVYAHGDLVVFYGDLFIAPLLPFFPNGFALHAFSGVVMSALFLGSAWWLARLLALSTTSRLLLLCLLASGISPYFAEQYFGQVAYVPVVVLLFAQLALVVVAYRAAELRRRGAVRNAALALAAVAAVGFLGNPARAAVTFAVPLAFAVGTIVVARLGRADLSRDHGAPLRDALVMGTAAYVAGAMIGTGLYAWLISRSLSFSGGAKRNFVALDALGDRLLLTVNSLLYLFGVQAVPGASVISLPGAEVFAHLLLLCAVLACAAALAAHPAASGPLRGARQGIGNAFLASLLTVGFLYVFTDLSASIQTSRYFTPAFALGFVAMICLLDERLAARRDGLWTWIAISVVVLVSLMSFRPLLAPLYAYYRATGFALAPPVTRHDKLAAFLRDNGLSYGYATFWNAHVLTVMSKGAVTVRPILLEGLPKPMPHLVAAHWYGPTAHAGRTFLMVQSDEAKGLDLARLEQAVGPVERKLDYPGYAIYVFAHNFDAGLLGWDFTVAQPSRMRLAAATPHTVGRFVASADDADGWLQADAGQAGALAYGPYVTLAPGRYEAEYEVAGCGTSADPAGTVDVSAFVEGTPTVLASAPIPPTAQWSTVRVPFDLARAGTGMEFRVLASGRACLRARSIALRRRS